MAAISTPIGRGGIGIIRLSGQQAASIALTLSHKKTWRPRYAHLCHWYDDNKQIIDQGLVLYFPAPNSYTGEDVVELHAHGNPVLLQSLLARLFELGAQAAEAGEFTRRALLSGRMDLSQAEAVIATIDAATTRAAKQAQINLDGMFGREISGLMDKLTDAIAHIEACLDFPEEELPDLFVPQLCERVQNQLIKPLDKLLSTADFGIHLFSGASIAIIGAPNVGKSSLLNALVGFERAIVSAIAGTTRDTLEADFSIHGIPIRLIDTAGMRASNDDIEQEGILRAHKAAKQADIVLFVADANRAETWQAEEHFHIAVMNKVDVIETTKTELIADNNPAFLSISAKTGLGMPELVDKLARHLGDNESEEGLLVTQERHRQVLEQARIALLDGIALASDESTLDLLALEWRQAWTHMGSILGIGDVEHILDRVFSSFCIGK
ncbi:MAG: tRNA uridine-5-carboxymethylaminomethyl(34) synthesis GTPase MnmE [Mariprofundales bacterium]